MKRNLVHFLRNNNALDIGLPNSSHIYLTFFLLFLIHFCYHSLLSIQLITKLSFNEFERVVKSDGELLHT